VLLVALGNVRTRQEYRWGEEYRLWLARPGWASVVAKHVLRFFYIHAFKIELVLLYVSVLQPYPEGIDLISLCLLATALGFPRSHATVSFCILAWMLVSAHAWKRSPAAPGVALNVGSVL
jgi:hypothetical protein